MDDLLYKQFYTIKDLAQILKKETQTIRSWERKGIIKKPQKNPYNNWRRYNRRDLAEILEAILSYPWERKVIKNMDEIQHFVDFLKLNPQIKYKEN